MVKRYVLAVLLALTGIMVTAAPMAAMAMSDSVYCAKVMKSQAAQTHPHEHMAQAAHGVIAEQEPSVSAPDRSQPICCDHACFSETAASLRWQEHPMHESRGIVAWTSSGRTGLTEPTGLRRPPKG